MSVFFTIKILKFTLKQEINTSFVQFPAGFSFHLFTTFFQEIVLYMSVCKRAEYSKLLIKSILIIEIGFLAINYTILVKN